MIVTRGRLLTTDVQTAFFFFFALLCRMSSTSLSPSLSFSLALSVSLLKKKKKTQTILLGVSIAPRSRCSVRSVRTAIAPMRRSLAPSLARLVTPG